MEVVERYRNPLEEMKLLMGSRRGTRLFRMIRESGLWGAPLN